MNLYFNRLCQKYAIAKKWYDSCLTLLNATRLMQMVEVFYKL